ncbi:hypothetical protein [Roseococcus pinisoli]|uniref:Hedgehog/Intein (Hint) domain-containing protein n=1 Tax=Roseococcus pinisoli TaxID=2835040 RepID=A0ABS5QDJ9_9PROT|nr:hypothetical protein [Roseococcus pinisoli]MBS7811463.1 hypothetical protein [Roseococcus pinisoli]
MDLKYIYKVTPNYKITSLIRDRFFTTPTTPSVGNLEAGDILVKMADGTLVNNAINIGQSILAGDHSLWTHAGLATSSTMIAEMNGKGLQQHSLSGENSTYTYAVFRCNYRQVAMAADEVNSKLTFLGNKIVYNGKGAVSSLFPSIVESKNKNRLNAVIEKTLSGGEFGLFCSEHVVFCYLAALEEENAIQLIENDFKFAKLKMQDFFNKEPAYYSPGYLYGMLMSNKLFKYLGKWSGMKWIG